MVCFVENVRQRAHAALQMDLRFEPVLNNLFRLQRFRLRFGTRQHAYAGATSGSSASATRDCR